VGVIAEPIIATPTSSNCTPPHHQQQEQQQQQQPKWKWKQEQPVWHRRYQISWLSSWRLYDSGVKWGEEDSGIARFSGIASGGGFSRGEFSATHWGPHACRALFEDAATHWQEEKCEYRDDTSAIVVRFFPFWDDHRFAKSTLQELLLRAMPRISRVDARAQQHETLTVNAVP
jgi:hypothetical protein